LFAATGSGYDWENTNVLPLPAASVGWPWSPALCSTPEA